MSALIYSKNLRFLKKAYRNLLSGLYPFTIRIFPLPKVASIEHTINHIIVNQSSISRYGDSEFLYIIDKIDLPYQNFDSKLRERMIEILISEENNHLVGLPIGFQSLKNLIPDSKSFWRSQITWIYPRLKKYLSKDKQYYNASMTRIYVTFEDKSGCSVLFRNLRQIWFERDIVLIEGEKSRLGMGNNLFENARSVKRVLAPMHHAFSKYDELLKTACEFQKNSLILIALGPTATVLAYDLHKAGYQALDIGNLDIEYEWFLSGAQSKVKINGKYTSEAKGGRDVEDIFDEQYLSEVVKRVL